MRKLFYFLLALPLVFAACETPSDPTGTPEKESLTLSSEEIMEFEAEGGRGSIYFDYNPGKVSNSGDLRPTTGKNLSIECSAEWIEVDEKVDVTLGQITFDVALNETLEPREAVIRASISEFAFEVTVKQAAGSENGNDDPIDEPEYVAGWAVNGTMNEWAKDKAYAMAEEGDYFVVKGMTLTTEDNFNFVLNGNEKSLGGNGQVSEPNLIYEAKAWGSNIKVTEAGEYDIYLDKELKTYRIMSAGGNPEDAEEALKPGEKRWSIFGTFEGNNRESDVVLKADGKYLTVRGVKFTDDMEFVVRCNGGEEGTYGVAEAGTNAPEDHIMLIEGGSDVKIEAEAGVRYDIFFIYHESASELWVMPEGRYPIIWDRVDGAYMPSYNNFILYLITNDIVLTLDFTAGKDTVTDSVIPEGTYYIGDTEGDGYWCFDTNYCIVKIRGREVPLLDGYMTIEHKDGVYDIWVDMRTATLDVLKMHYVGEIGFDPFFANMGGMELNNPAK